MRQRLASEAAEAVNRALVAILVLVVLAGALVVGLSLSGLDLRQLAEQPWAVTARNVFLAFLAAFAFYWAVLFLASRLEATVRREEGVALTEREMRAQTLAAMTRNAGTAAALVLGALLVLGQFLDIAGLLAAAGVVGIAIGFGAQSLVKDLIAGFFVLLENQFTVGDVIRAAGGIAGGVEKMTLRATYLRDLEGTLHVIPNGDLGVVSNLTAEWSRVVGAVGISYGSDLDRALEIMAQVCRSLREDEVLGPSIVEEPEVQAIVSFAESAVNVRALIKTRAGLQWAVQREFNRRVKQAFDQAGIEIAFPHRQIVLGEKERQLLAPLRRSASSESSEGSGSRASPFE